MRGGGELANLAKIAGVGDVTDVTDVTDVAGGGEGARGWAWKLRGCERDRRRGAGARLGVGGGLIAGRNSEKAWGASKSGRSGLMAAAWRVGEELGGRRGGSGVRDGWGYWSSVAARVRTEMVAVGRA